MRFFVSHPGLRPTTLLIQKSNISPAVYFEYLTHKFSIKNKTKQQYTCFFERGRAFFEEKQKKRPLPGMPDTVVRAGWFSPEIKNSRNSDKNHTIVRKGTRGKMTPQVFSIQCQSPFLFFHEIYSF